MYISFSVCEGCSHPQSLLNPLRRLKCKWLATKLTLLNVGLYLSTLPFVAGKEGALCTLSKGYAGNLHGHKRHTKLGCNVKENRERWPS